jgi:hypothetical protein
MFHVQRSNSKVWSMSASWIKKDAWKLPFQRALPITVLAGGFYATFQPTFSFNSAFQTTYPIEFLDSSN